eukprot:3852054-Lingulodinium_polyedra.AAC.1
MEPIDVVWQLPHAEKMTCLGQAARPVGGRPREDADLLIADAPEDEEPMVIKDDTMVPFAWHGLPLLFFRELLQVNNAIG